MFVCIFEMKLAHEILVFMFIDLFCQFRITLLGVQITHYIDINISIHTG